MGHRTTNGLLGRKYTTFVTTCLATATTSPAQPYFTRHDISLAADRAYAVLAADLDGDGDVDALSASYDDDSIRWYENDGTSAPHFTSHVISAVADGAYSVFVADVDGDGDADVLSASALDNTVRWYENGGEALPSFVPHVITATLEFPTDVAAADLDRDGDLDVLSASYTNYGVEWYENDGATPPSFTRRGISLPTDGAYSIVVADIDGDGDADVLASVNGTVCWYENNGHVPPAFVAHTVATDSARDVFAADLDGDHDIDLVAAMGYIDRVRWFENDGLSPPNFTTRTVDPLVDGARSVTAVDIDNDGDVDVLSAGQFDNAIRWHENNGEIPPAFTTNFISGTANRPWSVFAADCDGDGDADVLTASSENNAIRWYQNHSEGECEADLTTQGAGSSDAGWGVPDGFVTASDINYYVNDWVVGSSAADFTTQGAGLGDPDYGQPDGLVTAADINYYVNSWVAGCP